MMSFGGWGLETSHHKCQSTREASFEDGIIQVLYQRAPDIPFLYTAQPPYLHYRHLDRTFELGRAFKLRIRHVVITSIRMTIFACKNKTAKLKSTNWNWRPIRQIKFPLNFPAIRYIYIRTKRQQRKREKHKENKVKKTIKTYKVLVSKVS